MIIFMEGFDKYGPASTSTTAVATALLGGEWTTAGTAATFVAPLSAAGQAVQFLFNSTAAALNKTLPASYSRLIGGVRISVAALSGANNCGITFADAGTVQCSLTVNAATGTISLRSGGVTGTALATSSTALSVGSTHYLEWDITFGNAANYQVWLDGVSLFSGTGDTMATANASANMFEFRGTISGSTITFDDLYLFDSTGATNNAVLLNSPRIETSFPTGDSSVDFTVGAAILGTAITRTVLTGGPAVNSLVLRPFTPIVSGTLDSISIVPAANNAAAQFRPVAYADTGGGAAGTLLSSGSTQTGASSGVAKRLPLTTPQALTAGTQYWLGYMVDISVSMQQVDAASNLCYRAAATFASGAPGTAPAMTSGQPTYLYWGNLTSASLNWPEAAQNPPPGQYSYVYSSTVSHEDIYTFSALATLPASVHAVAVKSFAGRVDTGARTVSMRMQSGAADSGGSLTGQAPAATFGWLASYFPLDPDTSAAWTPSGLDAATSSLRIDA